ncbi:hypothetical protein Hypma_013469 [Hypsizygus marmoreus]|uniref:Uncharacterized protein n=1 Tax=Hypsizygus marmoreus TaxID=39966 RepID=A0A369JHX5_HYPMA|nr:hypothetical protein Hypma_013469 [Hypsizygus marmoreus]
MSTTDSTNTTTTTDQTESLVVINTVEVEVARLEVLLSQSTRTETDDADVAELFKHLDNAGDIAEDLEQKLDRMLAKLDDILNSMDASVDEEPAPTLDSTEKEK